MGRWQLWVNSQPGLRPKPTASGTAVLYPVTDNCLGRRRLFLISPRKRRVESNTKFISQIIEDIDVDGGPRGLLPAIKLGQTVFDVAESVVPRPCGRCAALAYVQRYTEWL
ncbi:hypothetical protein J6590_001041 [Homalodisca vitripennis]|nr:hypothetical protein J6590_001041 [Homalodisca vitripennis]